MRSKLASQFARRHRQGCTIESVERRMMLSGTPVPIGPEIQANTYTTGDQAAWRQAVDTDAAGNFVVCWVSSLQDGSGTGVYARRFAVDGTPRGDEFRVNTVTIREQRAPAVAVDADGDFVITWQSQQDPLEKGEKTPSYGIYAQRYDVDGQRLGGEFRVNTTTAYAQTNPRVASDDAGNFVVTWESDMQDPKGIGREYTNYGVYAQRYSAAGQKLGGEFRVNTHTAQDQWGAAVAMNGAGEFVVAWQSIDQDGSLWGIYAQRFSGAGSAVGGEFRVNTTTPGAQTSAAVAIAPGGDFAVGWQSTLDDPYGNSFARLFDAAGQPLGAEFRLHDNAAGGQTGPKLAADSLGGWVALWGTYGVEGAGYGIAGRRFDAAGAPVGAEFGVNATTDGDQQGPSVATQPDGRFVAAWTSTGQDGSGQGVYARLFAPPAETPFSDAAIVTTFSDMTGDEVPAQGVAEQVLA